MHLSGARLHFFEPFPKLLWMNGGRYCTRFSVRHHIPASCNNPSRTQTSFRRSTSSLRAVSKSTKRLLIFGFRTMPFQSQLPHKRICIYSRCYFSIRTFSGYQTRPFGGNPATIKYCFSFTVCLPSATPDLSFVSRQNHQTAAIKPDHSADFQ
ncbi:hypothetical protein M5K25_002272 [Dendrobium thyrsiflorum]|uniref:Uncharacterized protein n=1 Tax=Dendrobium thyrsiflorum TaxID=117978 RepID=A0ABD0VTZ8_DENTH